MPYSSVDPAALRRSLVSTPKGIPKTSDKPITRVRTPAPVEKSSRHRGKEQLSHLFAIVYPSSLVEGPEGCGAPSSLTAGLKQRSNASELKSRYRSCPIRGTPDRTKHCEAAAAAADAALDAYYEASKTPNGDEDGMLQDVVDLSLRMDEACAIDLFDRAE